MDGVILIVVSLFALSSVGHACFNSFYTDKRHKIAWLLYVHYALLLAFGACLVWLLLATPSVALGDLALSAVFVALVHLVRFVTDYLDLRTRDERIDLVRPVFDMAANLATIWFVLSVLAQTRAVLYLPASFLAAMLVFKELKYRIYDDVELRPGNKRTSTQGGVGPATKPSVSLWQAFLGRFFKSYFYILIGFALFYLCLARMLPEQTGLITDPGSPNPFLDGLGYTLAEIAPTWKRSTPLPIVLTVLTEFATNAAMIVWIGATIAQTANRRR